MLVKHGTEAELKRLVSKAILVFVVAVMAARFVGCKDGSEDWDGVVELGYSAEVLVERVKRRIGLVKAGVALHANLAADSVWTNVSGHTFIARSRESGESGIVSRRAKRMGIAVRGGGHGISRIGPGQYTIEAGFHIVDVFSPQHRYISSAVVPTSMRGRQILQHLGIVRRHSQVADRFYMDPKEVVYWRQLFHVVVRNRGFGPLYLRDESRDSRHSHSDSLQLFAQRYELDEVGDYALVGKDRDEQSYRHIFSVGGEYIMSVIQYGQVQQNGQALLKELGLVDQEGSFRGT